MGGRGGVEKGGVYLYFDVFGEIRMGGRKKGEEDSKRAYVCGSGGEKEGVCISLNIFTRLETCQWVEVMGKICMLCK